jgi:hypothetical protein
MSFQILGPLKSCVFSQSEISSFWLQIIAEHIRLTNPTVKTTTSNSERTPEGTSCHSRIEPIELAISPLRTLFALNNNTAFDNKWTVDCLAEPQFSNFSWYNSLWTLSATLLLVGADHPPQICAFWLSSALAATLLKQDYPCLYLQICLV